MSPDQGCHRWRRQLREFLDPGRPLLPDKTPETAVGLMHWRIGEYGPSDMEIVTAFDIDARKVGRDVNEAIFELPNCTEVFCTTCRAAA